MSTKYTDAQYREALLKKFCERNYWDTSSYNIDDEPQVANGAEPGAYVALWYWISDEEMAEMGMKPVPINVGGTTDFARAMNFLALVLDGKTDQIEDDMQRFLDEMCDKHAPVDSDDDL